MLQAMLFAIGAPLARQILISLGIGIISFGSSLVLINTIIGQVQSSFQGMPDIVLSMVSLFGVPESASILLGAFSVRAGISAVKKMGVL